MVGDADRLFTGTGRVHVTWYTLFALVHPSLAAVGAHRTNGNSVGCTLGAACVMTGHAEVMLQCFLGSGVHSGQFAPVVLTGSKLC